MARHPDSLFASVTRRRAWLGALDEYRTAVLPRTHIDHTACRASPTGDLCQFGPESHHVPLRYPNCRVSLQFTDELVGSKGPASSRFAFFESATMTITVRQIPVQTRCRLSANGGFIRVTTGRMESERDRSERARRAEFRVARALRERTDSRVSRLGKRLCRGGTE